MSTVRYSDRMTNLTVGIEGGWQSRITKAQGDDRALCIRITEPDNGTMMYELTIPAEYVLDLLSNRHNSAARATLQVIAATTTYGHVREHGSIIVKDVKYGAKLSESLTVETEALLRAGGWHYDAGWNGHRTVDRDCYDLHISRVVEASMITAAPATMFRDHGAQIIAGRISDKDGEVVSWGWNLRKARGQAKAAATRKRKALPIEKGQAPAR